ncbi:MAG: hypothetical protein ABF277_05270 [Candidatus Arcticimaribacter sp.]
MLNFIKTILGFIFFSFVFGLIIIKNGPKDHTLIIEQDLSNPAISYIEYLQSAKAKEEWIAEAFPQGELAEAKIEIEEITSFNRSEHEFGFSIPTNKNFTLEERWIFSPKQPKVRLEYHYTNDFRGQIFHLRRPYFKDSLRSVAIKRFSKAEQKITNLYQQHRYIYKGETTLPLTYYLALEGNSSWNKVAQETATAFETIQDFAKNSNIPIQKESFLVYPSLGDSIVRWRAAITVDRYYRTNSAVIKCRRFKGSKTLQLEHQGPNNFLKESWDLLRDSLKGKIQSYPLIQEINTANDSISNPLNWSTQLYIPIQ